MMPSSDVHARGIRRAYLALWFSRSYSTLPLPSRQFSACLGGIHMSKIAPQNGPAELSTIMLYSFVGKKTCIQRSSGKSSKHEVPGRRIFCIFSRKVHFRAQLVFALCVCLGHLFVLFMLLRWVGTCAGKAWRLRLYCLLLNNSQGWQSLSRGSSGGPVRF